MTEDWLARLFKSFYWPRFHLGLFAFFCLAFSATPLASAWNHPERNKDYVLWFYIGNIARLDADFYPSEPGEVFHYMYPPTLALFVCQPLVQLPRFGQVLVLVLVNSVCWLWILHLAVKAATGQSKHFHPFLYALPFLATVAYVYDSFLLGQINLFLLLPMLGAILCLRRNHSIAAGICLGIAASIKVFPLPAVAYFVVRRQWKAVASTLLSLALIWFILPAPLRGFERNLQDMQTWFDGMLADQSGNTVGQRNDTGFTFHNQSLVSVTHRLLRPVNTIEPDMNLFNFTPQQAQSSAYCLCGGLGCALLFFCRKGFARTPTAEAAEWSMVLLLAILCSPLAWTYFFVWTLPAWAVVSQILISQNYASTDRKRILAMAACSLLAFTLALTEQINPLIQAYGSTCWGAVLLFITCGMVVRAESRKVTSGHAPVLLPKLAA